MTIWNKLKEFELIYKLNLYKHKFKIRDISYIGILIDNHFRSNIFFKIIFNSSIVGILK